MHNMPPVRKHPGKKTASAVAMPYTPRTPTAVLSPIMNIADSGDVILVVGQEEAQKQFRVSSHMLRAASKAFNVMFGPLFQEGQQLDVNQPKSVPLPDDDADAMEILCRIIHLQNDSVTDDMDEDEVLAVAKLVDKYSL